jgi:allantoinase
MSTLVSRSRLPRLSRWLCQEPAKLAHLQRKGDIANGNDADLAVRDPNAALRVEPSSLYHRHQLTPYMGRTLYRVVRATFLPGQKVYDSGQFPVSAARHVLRRGEA